MLLLVVGFFFLFLFISSFLLFHSILPAGSRPGFWRLLTWVAVHSFVSAEPACIRIHHSHTHSHTHKSTHTGSRCTPKDAIWYMLCLPARPLASRSRDYSFISSSWFHGGIFFSVLAFVLSQSLFYAMMVKGGFSVSCRQHQELVWTKASKRAVVHAYKIKSQGLQKSWRGYIAFRWMERFRVLHQSTFPRLEKDSSPGSEAVKSKSIPKSCSIGSRLNVSVFGPESQSRESDSRFSHREVQVESKTSHRSVESRTSDSRSQISVQWGKLPLIPKL